MALQRQAYRRQEDEEELHAKTHTQRVGLEGGKVTPKVESAIQRARGGGQPVDRAVQEQMSEAMGYDFSRVRVHTNPQADGLSQQLMAKAFTTGPDIFFRRGAYDPSSSSGRDLIGHELSHVVQQGSNQTRGSGSGLTVRPADDSFEQEADDQGRRAARPSRLPAQQRAGVTQDSAGPAINLASKHGIGNQNVQRIIYHQSDQTYTAAGQKTAMEVTQRPANCHGFTYGTWSVERNGHNPVQSPDGVGVIVRNEAGSQRDSKAVTRNNAPIRPPSFRVQPDPGNLIIVARNGSIVHSAVVAAASGKRFDKVKVSNVQGYGGAVEAGKKLNEVMQITKGATVHLYEKTPNTKTERR